MSILVCCMQSRIVIMSICIMYLCFNILCLVATEVEYPTPDRFGNLKLPNVQVSMSGEYEVQVRLPGLGTNGEALNAIAPRSVNVDVQSE